MEYRPGAGAAVLIAVPPAMGRCHVSEASIDRLARAVAVRGNRRRLLAGMAGAASAAVVGRLPVGAQQCTSTSECTAPFTCQGGFCQDPGCTVATGQCTANEECCEGLICIGGACGVSARCGREAELCGNGCCSGLVCSEGYCVVETPAPPENTGGTSGGGGGSGGGGNNSGGGGTDSGGTSGAGSGTTTGGVTVAALPTTGSGPGKATVLPSALLTLAGAIGLGSLVSRKRLAPREPGATGE